MSAKDGGPAFPQANEEYIDHPIHGRIRRADLGMEGLPGMSLRDYFAGQALVGLLANGDGENSPDVSKGAYTIADAMLAERAKVQP